MRLGIISLGGRTSLAIAEACKKHFDEVDMLDIRDFEVYVNGGIHVTHLKKDLEKYDCIYIRGSFKYALIQKSITRALASEVYMPLKQRSFVLGHDKFLTILELQRNGVNIPRTYLASTPRVAKKILEGDVEYPIIMKVKEGTHGKGVLMAETLESAKTILDMLEDLDRAFLIQEFVRTKGTSDIRVVVCGKEILGAYKRIASQGEIRTNTHRGGIREKHELTEEEKELAIKSAEAIGAEICGVDILNAEKPSVIEVNLSPALAPIQDLCEGDVLDSIGKYLAEKTKKFHKRKRHKLNKKLKKIL